MKSSLIALCGAGAVASSASADFLGWTANVRSVSGGVLVNVFAVTDNSSDVLLNVFGGTPGTANAGFILTNSPGGFLQGAGALSVFAPSGSQNWTTLDSFLTVGGGFSTSTNAWLANGSTQGDPPWNVTYTDTDTSEATTVNSFGTQSNGTGFANPNVNAIPATAGWFLAGSTTPARSLATLTNRTVSSGAAAASATFGMMVAQLYVAQLDATRVIDWKMGATLKRTDGSTSSGTFQMTIPAPGALALLGIGGLAARRRRA
jgi:MYXO-CTERM domain-containing protein